MVYYYLLVFSCLLPFYFNQRKIILSKFYDIRDKCETESSNSSYQNQNWASLFIRKKNHCLHHCKWCVLGNCFHHVLLILIINTFSFRQRNRYNIKIQRFLLFPPREIRCARGQDRPGNPLRYSSHVPSLFLQYLQSFFQAEIYIKFTFHKRYIWVRFLQDVVHVLGRPNV